MVFGEAREPSHTELPYTCFVPAFYPQTLNCSALPVSVLLGRLPLENAAAETGWHSRGKVTTKPMKWLVARKAQHGNADSDSRGASRARGGDALFLLAALRDDPRGRGCGWGRAGALRCILPSLHKRAVEDGV